MIDKESIKNRNIIIDNAKEVLKKEFIGIDKIIDNLIENVRAWFVYPNLQTKPVPIVLVGMTGCGKTSLIKRLVELLDMEKGTIYYNFSDTNENNYAVFEHTLDNKYGLSDGKNIIIYDDFQYAATLGIDGDDRTNDNCPNIFWDLIDTGKVNKNVAMYQVRNIAAYIKYIDLIHKLKIDIKLDKNGEWLNKDDFFSKIKKNDRIKYSNVFNLNNVELPNDEETTYAKPYDSFDEDVSYDNSTNFIFSSTLMDELTIAYRRLKGDILFDDYDMYNLLNDMTIDGMEEFINNLYKEYIKGYTLDYSRSLIFILANVDEAYNISFNVNPDMSPDNFRKITEELTIVDIKSALQNRFRNEQIARLGNIYLIYPSFDSKSFKQIITYNLDKYFNSVKKDYKINIEYDDKLTKVIYNDSVYPTHGTRPIFTSLHEIVKSKLPLVINYSINNDIIYDKIIYTFKKDVFNANFIKDGVIVDTFKKKQTLRLYNVRNKKSSEAQMITAVHESGHFILHAELNGELPEVLRSVTADNDSDGFLLTEFNNDIIDSKKYFIDLIKIKLAGRVAEELVFGEENITSGASSDLNQATSIACRMVKEFCMDDFNYVSSSIQENNTVINEIRSKEYEKLNKKIKDIIDNAYEYDRKVLESKYWNDMFKESVKYLSKHSFMPKSKMKKLYNLIPDEIKQKNIQKNDFFVNKGKNFIES